MRQFNPVQAARDHVQAAIQLTANPAIQDLVEEATFDVPLELPPQRAFLLALNKSLQALKYPINPYPYSVTISAPPGAYIGDLDGAIANFLKGPHNHPAGLPAATSAQPQPHLLPPDSPRLWLFLALLADPLTQPLIGPRTGLMTISPANMRRVFTRLANKQFPASTHKHYPVRATPVASPTRTAHAPALTNITAGPFSAPMLAPVCTLVTDSTFNYVSARAKAAGESRARTAGILAHWALTMNPTQPAPRTRGKEKRSKLINVLMDVDTHTRFSHYAHEQGINLSSSVRHLLEWAQRLETTTSSRAYIDRPSRSRYRH
jgi:hypothetical protein